MKKMKIFKIIAGIVLLGLVCLMVAFSSIEVVADTKYGPTPEERKEQFEKKRVVEQQSWDELKQHAASYPEDSVSPSVNSFIRYIFGGVKQRDDTVRAYQEEQAKIIQMQQSEQMSVYNEITEQQRLMMEEMLKQQELIRKQLLDMQ